MYITPESVFMISDHIGEVPLLIREPLSVSGEALALVLSAPVPTPLSLLLTIGGAERGSCPLNQ